MSKRVLIVDADGEVQARCRQILAAEGFQVVGVATGKQGLAVLERERFDLVVVDYHLRDMGAGVFVRTVVGRYAQVPQVLMTAPHERTVSMVGVPVLRKPLSCEALVRVLERHCGHRRRELATAASA
jgi:DNA-binding NtrC family response regulator